MVVAKTWDGKNGQVLVKGYTLSVISFRDLMYSMVASELYCTAYFKVATKAYIKYSHYTHAKR